LSNDTPRIPEFAHYYGDWIWDEELTDWVKSLLLFFDGIALVLPPETADRLIESDSVLARPLAELGLLRNYEPRLLLRAPMRAPERYDTSLGRIAEIIRQSEKEGGPFRETFAELLALTARTRQKYGVPAEKRVLEAATASRLLSAVVTEVAIEPVIDDENAAAFVATLIGPLDGGRAKIVTGDLVQIGLDLSAVPLDEVLGFRSQYGSEYRRYARDVRQYVLELSLMDEADRHLALMDRRAELDDRAEQLRKIGRTAFVRQAISFGFGVAGAAWTLVHGDAWGAAFAAGAAMAGLTGGDPEPIGAGYTYILRAKAELAR